MRKQAIAALLAMAAMAAACEPGSVGRAQRAQDGGYTLEVFAREGDRIYLVARADGRETAARVRSGESALFDPSEAHGLIAQRGLEPAGDANVAVRGPGFSLSIAAKDFDAPARDSARVEIRVGAKSVLIDAADSDARRRALVRIEGADAEAARSFILEARGLSEATKAGMLRELEL